MFNNEEILRAVGRVSKEYSLNYYYPEIEYRSDNAAMIALSGYFNVLQKKFLVNQEDISAVDRDPRLSL